MATRRRGVTITEEDKRKLQKMADKGLIRYKDLSKEEKKKRIAQVLQRRQAKKAKAQEATNKQAATKAAEEKKKLGVGQRAPKESAAKLAERRRRFRASAKGFREQEMSKLKKETALKVGKELLTDAAIGVLTAPLGGPIAKVLSKGAQAYVRTKGGSEMIKLIGRKKGQKAIDWIEREAKRYGGSAAKETSKKAGSFKLKKGGRKPIAQTKPKRPGPDRKFTATGSGAPKPKPKVDFAPASKARVRGVQSQRSAPGKRTCKIKQGAQGRTPIAGRAKTKVARAQGRPDFTSKKVFTRGREATKGTPKFGRKPYGKGPTVRETTGKQAKEFLESRSKKAPRLKDDRLSAARDVLLQRRVPGARPGSAGGFTVRMAPKTAAEARKILKAAGIKGYTNMTGPQAIKAATSITRSRRLAAQGKLPRKPKVAKAAAPAKPATPRVRGRQGGDRTFKLAKSRTFATGKAAKEFLAENGVNASRMSAEQAKKVASNVVRAKRMAKEGRLPKRPAPQPRPRKTAQKTEKKAYSAPKVKDMTGKRAAEILTKAGMNVPAKASDRIAQAARIVRSPAKEPVKGIGPLQRGYLKRQAAKTKKAAAPKVSPRAEYKAKVDKMKPAALKKELAKVAPDVTYRNPDQARTLIMRRYSRAQRAAKGKKGTPRPERRNQAPKAKETEAAPAPRARRARRGKAKDKGSETKKATEPGARNTKASRRLSATIEKFADGRIGYDKMVNIINKSKDKIAKLSGEQRKQFARSMRRLGELSRLKSRNPSDAAEAKRHAKTISQMLAALGVISVASA